VSGRSPWGRFLKLILEGVQVQEENHTSVAQTLEAESPETTPDMVIFMDS